MFSIKGSKKINVLWLVDHLGYDGVLHGAGKYYLNTIPFFNENEFNVVLCVVRSEDNLTKYFLDKGINIKHLGRNKYDPRTLFDIIKLIKSMDISLIHSHGYGADNFGRVVGVLSGIPTIVHAHDDNSNYPLHQNLVDILLKGFTKKAIAVSESVKESCIRKRRINKGKLSVMHNGIPFDDFIALEKDQIQKEKERFNIKPGTKVIGTVARLREEKGVRFIIESAPKLLDIFPDTIFFIAGDGPLREELENLSKDLGVYDKIIFAGFRSDIAAVLSIIDIFVAPSLTEGSPIGILEAMAMGKPIIATNVGGIKEILKDGETGLFVPSKDPKLLAEKIVHLLKNENIASCLGKKAKEESKKYNINFYISNIEKLYLELI